jgi:hypothetical protein
MAVMQEVLVDKAKRTTISISQPTKRILDSIKHPGQSYDGLIQELIKLWEKEHGEKISK